MVVVGPIDVVVAGFEFAGPGAAAGGRGTPPDAHAAGKVEVPIAGAVAARQTRKTTAVGAIPIWRRRLHLVAGVSP